MTTLANTFLESKEPVDNLDSSARPVPDKKPTAESQDELKPQQAIEVSAAEKTETTESEEDGGRHSKGG